MGLDLKRKLILATYYMFKNIHKIIYRRLLVIPLSNFTFTNLHGNKLHKLFGVCPFLFMLRL